MSFIPCHSCLQFHPGSNVGLGKDYTIYSLIEGLVKFERFGPDHKQRVRGLFRAKPELNIQIRFLDYD